MSNDKLYWGDAHTNIHFRDVTPVDAPTAERTAACAASLEPVLAHARAVLDFWPIAYYPYRCESHNGLPVETHYPDGELEAAWRAVCDVASAGNAPGKRVVFPGYEWQGDGRSGDHNVFFLDDHPPLLLRCRRVAELYEQIRARGLKAYAIPHHTAYFPGVRSKDWSVHDEVISPFAEIFSNHGCSESDEELIGLRNNTHMGPGTSGGALADALDRGVHTGIVASTDGHHNVPGVHGWGLMACYAPVLTREALWEAFAARHVYGVTGDRIALDFRIDDAVMGDAVRSSGPVHARVRVRGCDAIDRIELLRNNHVIATHSHQGTWQPPTDGPRIRCKLRVEAGWGPRTDDLSDLPPREWHGRVDVPDGAIVSAEPCWRFLGQWIGGVGAATCEFGLTTRQSQPGAATLTEAVIFEIEARPSEAITIRLDERTVTMTLAEAMAGSQLVVFMDEAAARIRRRFGVDPATLERNDRVYYHSCKAKLHRAIPEAGLTAGLDHIDADPPAGENHYRVRVLQRNGQRAWSSPIWVTRDRGPSRGRTSRPRSSEPFPAGS